MRYKKLTIQTVFLTALLTTSILFFSTHRFATATSGTLVYVDPPEVQNIMPPANFTIKVKVANVTNLYGLDIQFTWDPTIIKYVSHTAHIPVETYADGVLHSPVIPVEDQVDENATMIGPAPGTRYWLSESSMSPAKVFNGSGTIFEMTFKVVGLGTSPLQILACTMANKVGNPINLTLQQGTFTNYVIHILPPAPANVTVSPSSVVNSSLIPGNNFTVNVNAQVDRLYAFTFWLSFNATLLNATSVTGNPVFPPATIVKTAGQVKVSSSLVSPSPPINGSLSLASVKFNILAYGTSVLDLHNVTLLMSNGTALPIHSVKGGYFNNMPTIKVHDVGVTSIVPDRMVIFPGYTAKINVTVLNNGNFSETTKVTLYYNITDNKIVGMQNITLGVGETRTLSFTWNALGVAYSPNYTLTAVATIPTGDATPADNTFPLGHIKVTTIGDVNGDGIVNILDVVMASRIYDSHRGSPNWNPVCDFNGDGRINILDLVTIIIYYGVKVY
jgi:hypothetical protein